MAPEPVIRSRHNAIYKQLRLLLRRDMRHRERAFLVEGPRFIADAQRAGAIPRRLVCSESHASLHATQSNQSPPVRILDDALFATLTDTVTSQGLIGVFPFPDIQPPPESTPLLLITAGIQDPGNLGTLIRSAAAAGATGIIALPGTVDPWAPKTVRAAAAAHFGIRIENHPPQSLRTALPPGITIVGADAAATTAYDRLDLTGPLAVIVGAEGHGLPASTHSLIDRSVSIPLHNQIESLNAAVAGSIILFEASRQRRLSSEFGKIPRD